MNRHPFDPLSFVLGVAAVVLGVLVALDRIGEVQGGWGTWAAAAALAVGIALVPWGRARGGSGGESLEQ
jgi:hypothetical protein